MLVKIINGMAHPQWCDRPPIILEMPADEDQLWTQLTSPPSRHTAGEHHPAANGAANYLVGERRGNCQTADRSSAGLLPNASEDPDAFIGSMLRGRFAGGDLRACNERDIEAECGHFRRAPP